MPLGVSFVEIVLALPYPVVLLWVLWTIFTPAQVVHLLNRKGKPTALPKSGELMSLREVTAVGCVGGFILLTFITAYCCYLMFRLRGII